VVAPLSDQIEVLQGLVFRVVDLVVDRTPAHLVVASPEAQSPVHREEAREEAVVVRQAEPVAVVAPPDN